MSVHTSSLVLEYRGPDGKPILPWSARKTAWIALGTLLLVGLLMLAIVLYLAAIMAKLDPLKPSDWPALWAVGGKLADRAWQGLAAAPWSAWIEPIGGLLALPVVLLMLRAMGRRRLHIGDDGLDLVSGLPAWLEIGPWASWTMPYQDIASVDLVDFRAGRSVGPRPLQRAALQFNSRDGKAIRRLAVTPWHRPGEGVRPKPESSAAWLGVSLGTWNSDEDQQTLARAYDALPLVMALRQRGVAVPTLAQGKGAGGDDLFENPRMKTLILAALVLAPAYFAGAFLLREYWVVSPPIGFWVALGLLLAVAGGLWLRGTAPDPRTALANQLIVAMLFGLSAASAAFAAVPLVNQWLFAAEDAVFVVQAEATLEPVVAAAGLPNFRPEQSIDFWISRKPGTQYTLRMRKLPLGYWQYSVDAFRPEIEAFETPSAK
jgi:hypothetical protein